MSQRPAGDVPHRRDCPRAERSADCGILGRLRSAGAIRPSLRIIVTTTRLQGFVWKVVQGNQELRSGVADTRIEAEAQADTAMKELQAKAMWSSSMSQ